MMIRFLVALQGEGHKGHQKRGQDGGPQGISTIAGIHAARITVGQLRVVVLDLQQIADALIGAHPGATAIRAHCAVH